MWHLLAVLRANAVSCLVFGFTFFVWPDCVAMFLGAVPSNLLQILGIILLANGVHLAIASARSQLALGEVLYFSGGDILWFVASVGAVAAGSLITTVSGQLATLVVATGVLGLGLAQVWYLAEMTDAGIKIVPSAASTDTDLLPPNLARSRAIGASWKSMHRWVKLWLFALNGLFLGAIAFLPEALARITLAAYVSSGPLLAVTMIWQRGFTRVLGLAHLVPWIPLAVYLALRLTSDVAGPIIAWEASPVLFSYAVILLSALMICLALDIYDC
jgi:hypothetical protein